MGAARGRSEREPEPSGEEGVAGVELEVAGGGIAVAGMEAGEGAHLVTGADTGAGIGLEAGSGAGEQSIATLLQGGVRLATTLLVLALASSFLLDLPLGNTSVPFGELFDGSHGWIRLLAQFGLLTLAATPLLRVALAALVFTRSGQRGQATVAAAVLAMLILAMFLGMGSAG